MGDDKSPLLDRWLNPLGMITESAILLLCMNCTCLLILMQDKVSPLTLFFVLQNLAIPIYSSKVTSSSALYSFGAPLTRRMFS